MSNIMIGPIDNNWLATVTGMPQMEGLIRPPRPSLAEAIGNVAGGEPIEGVVIGQYYHVSDTPEMCGKVLTWDEARPILHKLTVPDFDPFCAWTPTKVIFSREYDGSFWVGWLPRNPVAFAAKYNEVAEE
jgi:hypothetical protein